MSFEALDDVVVVRPAPAPSPKVADRLNDIVDWDLIEDAVLADVRPVVLPHEYVMKAGRINKLPVSWALQGQFTQTTGIAPVPNSVHVRTRCSNAKAARDECDPGLLVVVKDTAGNIVDVLFNANSTSAGGNGFGAYLGIEQPPSTTRVYHVVAYSQNRGTSHVHTEWDSTSSVAAPDWDFHPMFDPADPRAQVQSISRDVGGALVRIGPSVPGQSLNLRTSDDAASANHGTRMWVFNQLLNTFVFEDGPQVGDRDPVLLFTDAWRCTSARCAESEEAVTYAIIGKDSQLPAPEVFTDLVTAIRTSDTSTPFSFGFCIGDATRPDCLETSEVTLNPGVYSFSVFASAGGRSVGDLPAVDGRNHPASETGDSAKCGTGDKPARGQGNDLAFTLELVEDGQVVARRHVPRGALGARGTVAGSTAWNRISLEHVARDNGRPHRYRLNIRDVGPSVTVRDTWGQRQNPENVELRVASLNIEYGDDMQKLGEVQNAADLLGAGPTYNGSQIRFRNDRERWHWESDIINLNEILSGRGAQMETRLNQRTMLSWRRSEGESVWADYPTGTDRRGPVLLNELARRGGGDPSFGTLIDGLPDCDVDYNHCKLAQTDEALWTNRHYYTVPARGAARRLKGSTGGYQERPIGVFHLYLPPDNDQIGDRDAGSTKLVSHMSALLARDPASFNSSASTNPLDPGNRMIVLGDSNMMNQQCSEINTLLRKLRAEFGYAVDTAMAVTDRDHRSFDGHYSGAPLTDFRTGSYGDCRNPSWTEDWDKGISVGCPFHYENAASWMNEGSARYQTGLGQFHAWWGGTSSGGGGGGSRLDVIVLAGLGWADDDPVQEYLVMSNNDVPHASNDFWGGGVEIRHYCSDAQVLSAAAGNYIPENSVCGETPRPGSLAVRTDHKPVSARLRVQFMH